MKNILFALLVLVAVCAGCSTQYTLTLTNGDVITSRGKPRFDQARGRYYYKDSSGQPAEISAAKVREVSPTSMADKGGARFLPSSR